MTLLQHLNSGSYVSNDVEISEILRMKSQKRIQNVMTGGGIVFDNSSNLEKEQKPSKTSSVLINDFDNDAINSLLFTKKFSLDDSPKTFESDPADFRLSNSFTSESSLLSDNFPLLNSKSAREAPLSSPLCVPEPDGIQLSFESEKTGSDDFSEEIKAEKTGLESSDFSESMPEEPDLAESSTEASLAEIKSGKTGSGSSEFKEIEKTGSEPEKTVSDNFSDIKTGFSVWHDFSSAEPFLPDDKDSFNFDSVELFRIRSHSQSSINIFDPKITEASQKFPEASFFDEDPCLDSKSPFSAASQESSDDSFISNLNDLSSLEKKIVDKDPFATPETSSSKTGFNIVPSGNIKSSSSGTLSSGAIFKFAVAKLASSESIDNNEDDNISSNDSESCCDSLKPIDKSKSVNNIQILSNTLKSLKLSCWYYENLSHFEAIKLLSSTQPGTFLVRNSSDSKFLFTLSIQTYRQPTSIRIQYNDGKFCLDCENNVTETIPKFNSIMDLIGHYIKLTGNTVHYINNNVVNENKQVLIDEYGKIFSNILLTKPLYSSTKVPSLKHLARVNLNRFKEFGYSYKIPSEELKKYMNEYPFTI